MLGMDPKLRPVVEKFLEPGIEASTVDAVGPSPIIIHKPLLKRVAKPWWDMSQRMQHDRDAQVIFGWGLEMWGYNLAVRNMGIRHTVSKDIQVEPQGEGTDDMDTKFIYHYTFGLTPKPPYPGAPSWRIDKRQYYGNYPSDHLQMPPACTAKSGFIIASMWNEAAQSIEGWKSKHPPPEGSSAPRTENMKTRLMEATKPEASSGLPSLLRGTGPWQWGNINRIFFYSRGIAYIPGAIPSEKGPIGTWEESEPHIIKLTLCSKVYTLRFPKEGGPWTFTATDENGRATTGTLTDHNQRSDELLPGVAPERTRPAADAAADGAPLLREIAGSGPWFWAGSGPFGFMRGGVLITPWGTGTWGVTRSDGEEAPSDAVFADFANSQHALRMNVPECLRMQSRRKADGDVVGIDFAGNAPQVAAAATCGTAVVAAP